MVRNNHEGIVTQEEFDKANGNMRNVVQGKRGHPASGRNFSVIVCPHCGLRLRPGTCRDSFMYCPTGRNHKDSVCRDVAEDTLVRLVRQQAEMLVRAEDVLKERKNRNGGKPAIDVGVLKAELKRLAEGKIADYERYKAGEISRETFLERKDAADVRKRKLDSAMAEWEARNPACDEGQKAYGDALKIKEYLHLETFDKAVMASLISSAKVMGEECLEVEWKYQDIYEKIFAAMPG